MLERSAVRNARVLRRIATLGLGLLALTLAGAPSADEVDLTTIPRTRVGELATKALSSPHPYPAGFNESWEIHHPGATYIKVHIARMDLAPGDRLVVSDPEGRERYTFRGKGYKQLGEDFWLNSVLGDRITLRLESANPTGPSGYGFDVDYYAYGIEPLFPEAPIDTDSVCGANDWLDVACYETSHPTEFDRARRAVVVLFNGTENCSGVKVGCPNQILTNEHCVTSQAQVNVTEVRFEYQNAACGGGGSGFSQSYLGDTFILDNFTLDFSLITVEGSSDDYLAAEIDPRLPPVGERLYITGHPAGSPKKLSLEDSSSPTGLCRADISPINGRGANTDVGYFCDTTGGSSGSPVWSGETHKLIALHHFGGCPNSGVRMDLIYPHIEPLLTSCCDELPNVPTLTAQANGDNRIDLTWDDSTLDTVVEYRLMRSRNAGGPYTTIATVADTSPGMSSGNGYAFTDWDVSGGIAYHYVVRSTDGSTCTSEDSLEAVATASGACTLHPVFAGAQSTSTPAFGVCTLELFWSAGTSECGGSVVYDVHRSTVSGFAPGASNLLAADLAGTAFVDISQLVDGTTYYYKVRARDTSNGVSDPNEVEVAGAPTGQVVGATWFDDAGDTDLAKLTTGNGWSIDDDAGQSVGAAYVTGTYAANACAALTTPELQLGVGSQLAFWSHYDIETGLDKGELQLTTNDGASWQRVALAYPGSAAGDGDSCGLPAGTYFTGSDAVWREYTADLGAWAGQTVRLRWLLSSDGSTSGDGWWIDDISVTNVTTDSACATGSTCPDNPFVNVAPDGPQTVCLGDGPTLTAELSGGNGPFLYQWIRDGAAVPGETGSTYRPEELGVHSYNVRVKSASCPDEVFDGLDTQIYRVNAPFFDGIASAVSPQDETCTVEVNWDAASTVCDGPVRFNVYRDTVSPVSATTANLIAGGLSGTSYVDTHDLANEQVYHYLVRAHDVSTGQSDGNAVEAAAAPDGPGNGLNVWWSEDFEAPASFAEWTVTLGPGAHSCGAWARSTVSSQRPAGSSGIFIVADSNCQQIAPRTSASIDSPAIDLDLPNLLAVHLEADVRYGQGNGDDGTIEVWDGAQWIVVWNDPNANFNQRVSIDVSAWAMGNPAFRVRFNYQNANADQFFAVDDVEIVTDIASACETAPLGPPAVPGDSLLASRNAGGGIDLSWDASSCPAAGYNLLYGALADVASYTLAGSVCAIGATGSFDWATVPAGSLYFLIVGNDGAGTESSWGRDSGQGERNGLAASGECGTTAKDPTNVCP